MREAAGRRTMPTAPPLEPSWRGSPLLRSGLRWTPGRGIAPARHSDIPVQSNDRPLPAADAVLDQTNHGSIIAGHPGRSRYA